MEYGMKLFNDTDLCTLGVLSHYLIRDDSIDQRNFQQQDDDDDDDGATVQSS